MYYYFNVCYLPTNLYLLSYQFNIICRAEHEHVDFVEILEDPDADLSEVNPLPSTHAFIDFLRRRALDDSVYVRKNALQVNTMTN